MGRFIAFLLFLALVIALLYGITKATQYFTTRRRQKLAAEFAPEMLRYENLPSNLVTAFIEQRKQIDEATAIMIKMVEDPYFDLTTEYHTHITSWLKGQQKEITK